MSWLWHAGYVKDLTQAEIAEAVLQTIESATNSELYLSDEISYVSAVLSLQFGCISPQEEDWTGIWGITSRFLALVFEKYKFTGMLIGGEDEETESPGNDYWYYLIFHSGVIVDWYVSNRRMYFEAWSEFILNDEILPYIRRKGRNIPEDEFVRYGDALRIIEGNAEVFRRLRYHQSLYQS